jgi:hypothetical protein
VSAKPSFERGREIERKIDLMRLLQIVVIVVLLVGSSHLQISQAQEAVAKPAGNSSYIGLRHGPRLPAGLKEMGGGLITDPYKDTVQFGLAHIIKGKTQMLWFELGTHHDAEGHAYWEVLDVVTLPAITRNQFLFYTLCYFNGQPDPEIAAIVQPLKRGGYETKTLWAWRANRQSRKLTAIPVKGVKCEMQGDD